MKKKITREDALNWWLQKYHNTTVEEVAKSHPEECKTPEWFKLYPVTQEQHDEWYNWIVDALAKERRMSKTYIMKHFSFDYLDCAPYIMEKQHAE